MIAGMGGLGTASSELLASIGIGNMRIVDYDVIELTNLPRQKLYNESDIGKAKVDVAEERLILRNPTVNIDPKPTKIDALSVNSLIDGIDVIVDGLDLFSTRKILHKASYEFKIPYVFAGALAESANIMTITHKENTPCLECVLGDVMDNREQSCEIAGVHPGILHLAAGIQATETVRLLLDQPPNLESTMLYIDLETLEFERIKFKKRETCKVCGITEEGKLDEGIKGEITRANREIKGFGKALITSICGRNTLIINPSWDVEWDFLQVKEHLMKKFQLIVDGKNYATFNTEGIGISLLSSGVTTMRGAKSSKIAIDIFEQLLIYIFEK